MNDLISRKAVLKGISLSCTGQSDVIKAEAALVQYVKKIPSAEPEKAKRIVGKSRDGMTLWCQCDMCNEPVDARDDFCRGCGRRLIDE